MNLHEITTYLDELLRVASVPDYDQALNGLQVENGGTVTRVAAAVDASEQTIKAAIALECDLLIVHHGLFWDGPGVITGRRYRRLKLLLDHGLAVYSAHLPLDVHPDLGNNVLLARALSIEPSGTFGDYKGQSVGIWGALDLRREVLAARLDDVLGVRVKLIPGGPERISRVGIMTGGAGSRIADAAAFGLDAFITGEGAHHTYFDAMELGLNVYYGGHYATETFGVNAVLQHLGDKFKLPGHFIDLPTGL